MTVPVTAPEEGPAAETSPRGALSHLIKEANEDGLTYGQMADRAAKLGMPLVKQYFQKLSDQPPANAPSAERLRVIAGVIRKPERRVQEAAAEQWLGYEATELAGYGEEVRIIVGHLAGKTEAEQRRWRAMIEADERAQREG